MGEVELINLGKLSKQQRLTKDNNNINILERISEKEECFYENNKENIFWIEHSQKLLNNEQFIKRKFIFDKMGEKKNILIEKELLSNIHEFCNEINNNPNYKENLTKFKNHLINERKYYGIKITSNQQINNKIPPSESSPLKEAGKSLKEIEDSKNNNLNQTKENNEKQIMKV
uniref:Uncharacterized protein n=1 Tax=Meloidogyne floridensis TaxID=298350 RepID=A0A915NKG7_9BILA